MIALTSEQRRAAENFTDNILLFAPAGTGKTATLAVRIANIVRGGLAAPAEILGLTFTNKACRELKARAAAEINAAASGGKTAKAVCGMDNRTAGGSGAADADKCAANDFAISTIHAFALGVLRSDAARRGAPTDFSLADEEDGLEVIAAVIRDNNLIWELRDAQLFISFIKMAIIAGGLHRTEGETAEHFFARAFENARANFAARLKKIPYGRQKTAADLSPREAGGLLAAYQSRLEAAGRLDFDDILLGAAEIWRDETAAAQEAARYKYIIIDEAQDMNLAEYRLLARIFGQAKILLAGDFVQTIYEWRGSLPEAVIGEFRRDYQPCEIYLRANFRSTLLLLAAAGDFLENVFPQSHQPFPFGRPYCANEDGEETGEPILFRRADTRYDEARWIFRELEKLALSPAEFSRAAVLVRSNDYAAKLADALNDLAAQDEKKSGRLDFLPPAAYRFFRRQEIKDVLAFLRLVDAPDDSPSICRLALRFFPRLGIRTLRRLGDEGRSIGLAVGDLFALSSRDAGDIYQPLLDALEAGSVVVFDTETTGTDTRCDDIIQLAAIKIGADGRELARFVRFIKPSRPVGASEAIHHFSDAFLAEKGEAAQIVLRDFAAFAEGAAIVGHNVRFDLNMFAANARRYGAPPLEPAAVFDTLTIFRRFYPDLPNHKLGTLGRFCCVSHASSHDALDDVCATAEILLFAVRAKIRPLADCRRAFLAKAKAKRPIAAAADAIGQFRRAGENLPLTDLISYIVKEMGVKDYYLSGAAGDGIERVKNLRRLYLLAAEFMADGAAGTMDGRAATPAEQRREFLASAALNGGELETELKLRPKIPVVTVHQAKGMEFDYVFVAGLAENVFPSYLAVQQKAISEEARLFYVAITRAKKRLYLSTYRDDEKYGWEKYVSRFVNAIPAKYVMEII